MPNNPSKAMIAALSVLSIALGLCLIYIVFGKENDSSIAQESALGEYIEPEIDDLTIVKYGEVQQWDFKDGFPVIAIFMPCDVDAFMSLDPSHNAGLALDDFINMVFENHPNAGIVPIEQDDGRFNFGLQVSDAEADQLMDYAIDQLDQQNLCEGLPA